MHRSPSIVVLLTALLFACSGAARNDSNSGPGVARTPAGYEGPELSAKLVGSELHVSVRVNTGGYRLELRETGRGSDHTFVKVCLTAPGDGKFTTQAFEVEFLRIPLIRETGPVHVHLQQVQRGVHYITEPEFVLAKILPR